MSQLVYLAHILVFSTFLGYIGIWKDAMPKVLYPIILCTGLIVILYHMYKFFLKKDPWVNYIHILLIGPLLVYIGLYKEKTSYWAFEVALLLAFAAFGYHSYYFIKLNM